MQEVTENTAIYVSPLYDVEKLTHPDFLAGFSDGIGAYESECEEKGRILTGFEVCKDISKELDPGPRIRANMEAMASLYDFLPDPLFTTGFLAGWIYAHLVTPELPALPETQPLGVVVPFRARAATSGD